VALLEEDLVQHLKEQAAIVAAVQNRITPVFLPQGYVLPAIVFRLVSSRAVRSVSVIDLGLVTAFYEITAWHLDYFESKRLAAHIRAALDDQIWTLGTREVLELYYVDGSEQDVVDDESRASNIPFGVQAQYALFVKVSTAAEAA